MGNHRYFQICGYPFFFYKQKRTFRSPSQFNVYITDYSLEEYGKRDINLALLIALFNIF
jgi:hypothetical protein